MEAHQGRLEERLLRGLKEDLYERRYGKATETTIGCHRDAARVALEKRKTKNSNVLVSSAPSQPKDKGWIYTMVEELTTGRVERMLEWAYDQALSSHGPIEDKMEEEDDVPYQPTAHAPAQAESQR